MNANYAHHLKIGFNTTLVISVLGSALFGCLAIVWSEPDFFATIAFPTCLIGAAASACGLACAALAARGRVILPVVGMVLAVLASGLLIRGVWAEHVPWEYWRLAWSVAFFAVAYGHLAALSLARLAPWHWWCLALACVLVLGAATLAVILLYGLVEHPWTTKLLAMTLILDAAVTILVPYCHWLSRDFVAQTALERA